MVDPLTLLPALAGALRELARQRPGPNDAAATLDSAGPWREAGVVATHRRRNDHAIEYDVLVPAADGTFLLTFVPDEPIPLLLRSAEPVRDHELLRVDGTVLTVHDAVSLIDFVWDERRILVKLVDACVVRHELERAPIEPDDTEVQRAVDHLRAAHGLYTAASTRRWLADRGWSEHDLERRAEELARIELLRRRVAGPEVEKRLAASPSDHDWLVVAWFDVPDDDAGRALADAVERGTLDPWAALGQAVTSAPVATIPSFAPTIDVLRRRELDAGVAPPGRRRVLRVLREVEARLDDATRRAIEADLFDEWLAARRRGARIEWNWGAVARTTGVVGGP